MNKTPEELAEDWCNKHSCHLQMTCHAEAYLAGYQAAKDYVDDFNKVMNFLNNANRWINVKDRLPEITEDKHNNHPHIYKYDRPHIYKYDRSERVLVLFRDCDIDDERVCIGRFISVLRDIENSRPEQWVECDEAGSAELGDIVAWMPLPAAPKEEV
jgi:hypothetical protein